MGNPFFLALVLGQVLAQLAWQLLQAACILVQLLFMAAFRLLHWFAMLCLRGAAGVVRMVQSRRHTSPPQAPPPAAVEESNSPYITA